LKKIKNIEKNEQNHPILNENLTKTLDNYSKSFEISLSGFSPLHILKDKKSFSSQRHTFSIYDVFLTSTYFLFTLRFHQPIFQCIQPNSY